MAGLYIHVPFCHSKCAYCDFYSLPAHRKTGNDFSSLLVREWQMRRHETGEIRTVYIGGGTPSLLGEEEIGQIASIVHQNGELEEFTIEVNPEDVNDEKAALWKRAGINRVSMGIQSLIDTELQFIGRRHCAHKAVEAYHTLRRYFDNISVDIIMALPGQTIESLAQTIDTIIALRPEHISAYILSYEKGTRLGSMLQTGKIIETDDATVCRMYVLVCRKTAEAGYEHYEISNFSLPGRKSRHNSAYWENTPYLGLGPGAHSFDGTKRRVNPSNISLWSAKISQGECAFEVEEETAADVVNDRIMVRMRTAEGLDLNEIPVEFQSELRLNLTRLPEGRVLIRDNRVIIPEKAWLMSDDTISRLFVED